MRTGHWPKTYTCANVNTQLLCYAVKNIVSPFTYIRYTAVRFQKYLGQQKPTRRTTMAYNNNNKTNITYL